MDALRRAATSALHPRRTARDSTRRPVRSRTTPRSQYDIRVIALERQTATFMSYPGLATGRIVQRFQRGTRLAEYPLSMATPTIPAPTTTIHLQYFGAHHAVLVSELTPGCVTVWNTGALAVVTEITPVSKCFVNVTTRALTWNGAGYSVAEQAYTRKMKFSRPVGYSPKATNELAAQ